MYINVTHSRDQSADPDVRQQLLLAYGSVLSRCWFLAAGVLWDCQDRRLFRSSRTLGSSVSHFDCDRDLQQLSCPLAYPRVDQLQAQAGSSPQVAADPRDDTVQFRALAFVAGRTARCHDLEFAQSCSLVKSMAWEDHKLELGRIEPCPVGLEALVPNPAAGLAIVEVD